MRYGHILPVLAIVALILSGCGNVVENVTETVVENVAEEVAEQGLDGTEIDLDLSEGGLTVTTDGTETNFNVDTENGSLAITDGEGNTAFSTSGEIPEGFPQDVVTFAEGMNVVTAMEVTANGKPGYSVVLTGEGDIAAKAAEARANLEAAGFVFDDSVASNIGDTFAGTGDNGTWTATVLLGGSGDIANHNYLLQRVD